MAGFMPRFDTCTICGKHAAEMARFDSRARRRGLRRVRSKVQSRRGRAPETLAALARVQAGKREPMAPDHRARARELLNLFIEHQIGRKLKSVDFMRQVGLD